MGARFFSEARPLFYSIPFMRLCTEYHEFAVSMLVAPGM